jgi:phage tail protein X
MQVRESIPTAERDPVAQWLWHETTEMLTAVLTANPGLKNGELRLEDSCRA